MRYCWKNLPNKQHSSLGRCWFYLCPLLSLDAYEYWKKIIDSVLRRVEEKKEAKKKEKDSDKESLMTISVAKVGTANLQYVSDFTEVIVASDAVASRCGYYRIKPSIR